MSSRSVVVHPKLEVSSLDNRTYRAITLSNSLSVLLISDIHTDKAAAAMDVSVGHFSDPASLPGLAHFLEHMLFLGTEKYPEEGSYNRFLAENGGFSNAYTSAESTNFHFEMVSAKATNADGDEPRFKEALDRFAQFFTAPLFTESATERELNAVHAEHQKNLQSDSRRVYQLRKAFCNPEHPYCKFGTGSKETLWDTPKKAGVDTRKELLAFHREFYSANLMALCVIAPYDMDVLQKWVVDLFSSVANHNAEKPYESYRDCVPFLPEHLGFEYRVESIKDIRMLEMQWVIPSGVQYYRSKPAPFIAGLLGDEGDGSILSLLKVKGWADSLSAGLNEYMNFGIFIVSLSLTKEGVEHTDDVIGMVYEYIRMIRPHGIKEWYYKEEATLAETSFRFHENSSPFSTVTNLAGNMHHYPPEEYLSGGYLFKEFDPDLILKIVDCLTPENCNIVLSGKFVAGTTDKTERWYETRYRHERIEDTKLRCWKEGSDNPELRMPKSNPFVPTDFELQAEPLPKDVEDFEGPKVVVQNEYICVHHKLDRTFRRPKATISMLMISPLTYQSPWHGVMANIFTYMLEDSLTEYSYAAERAGFEYSLSHSALGLRLHVQGYSHRIDVLLNAVIKKMTTFEAEQTRFEMIRDAVERDYGNFAKTQPYQRAMYNISILLEVPRWHVNDYIRVLKDGSVTLEALNKFAKDVQKRMFLLSQVHGNITEESAKIIMKSVQKSLSYEPLPESEYYTRRVVQVPPGKIIFTRMTHSNPDDNNSGIDIFFEIGPRGHFETDAKLELLADIMSKPTFHELRTVLQLGYVVHECVGNVEHVRGISFILQSTVATPDELYRRVEEFLVKFRNNTLEEMSEDKFLDYVRSLIAINAEPDKKLASRSHRFWKEIVEGYHQHDRAQKEIESLKTFTKNDIVVFFDKYIKKGGVARRGVVSQVYGNQHPLAEKAALPDNAMELKNSTAFQRQNPLYPVRGIHYPYSDAEKVLVSEPNIDLSKPVI